MFQEFVTLGNLCEEKLKKDFMEFNNREVRMKKKFHQTLPTLVDNLSCPQVSCKECVFGGKWHPTHYIHGNYVLLSNVTNRPTG